MSLNRIWDYTVYPGASVFCQILCPLKLWLKQTPPWQWLIEVKSLCGFLCKDPEATSVLHLLGEKQCRNHSDCMVWCLVYSYSGSWAAAEAKIPQVQVRTAPWKTLFVHPNIVYTDLFWVFFSKPFALGLQWEIFSLSVQPNVFL